MEHHRGLTMCAELCPLCSQSNQCACVRTATHAGGCGVASLSCWCATEEFPPELLQLIPEVARGRACVCQSCVKAHALTQ